MQAAYKHSSFCLNESSMYTILLDVHGSLLFIKYLGCQDKGMF